MLKKIMNPISYIIGFLFECITTFPIVLIVGAVIVAIFNLLIFQVEFGYWYIWYVLFISIFGTFVMTVNTFEK